jgi:DNA-binding transcriptional ArsR family regulator
MAFSKASVFEATDKELALFAKGLAHPARIAIIRYLAEKRTCICGDIVEELPLSQSTVSQHLKELKRCGLIQGDVDGPRVCYCIHEGNWKKLREAFSEFFEMEGIDKGGCEC